MKDVNMATNVLPYNLAIKHMSLGCIASSAASSLVLIDVLATFVVFKNRVDCCFNRFIVIFCALQLLQCLQKIVFATMTILNGGLPFVACDINASLDQFLDFTSISFLIAFFVGMSNTRRYWESGWNRVAYIAAPLLSFVVLGTLWALLTDRVEGVTYSDAPYFTQDLAWCWIPNKPDGDLVIIRSADALRSVQMIVGYAPTAFVIASAIYAYLAQKCRTGESWLGKGVVLRRFLGVSIFPVVIYVVGLPIRISFAANANAIAIVISTMYPLTGSIIGFVFLWTEGGATWIPRDDTAFDCTAPPAPSPAQLLLLLWHVGQARRRSVLRLSYATPSEDGRARRFSDLMSPSHLLSEGLRRSSLSDISSHAPSSPKRSGLSGIQDSWLHSEEAVPTSFTATLRTMMCDAVVGQHVASSRAAIYSARYGRIVSDRHSIADSAATTESAFEGTAGSGAYGEEFLSYQIYVDPASRRSVKGDHQGTYVYDENSARNSSLQELRTQQRLSDGPHLGTPNTRLHASSQFTTRSERSSMYTAPHVRVRESTDTPSSSMLQSYSNRSSAQRLQSSAHLSDSSVATFAQEDGGGASALRMICDNDVLSPAAAPAHSSHKEEEEVYGGME
ncbi:transmembrane protein, putative [Bodo saltans]|uniref:Transmembrane protein, putative n=1 Tax=Bodo saltans TaxID=75058 RepID=A0A0S4JG63_BODSA|nr:transmembrane protein, putative [Bodo saltans]|eukprot:CUG89163.1 transmembrane protein, putative [Bodo saltans]